MFDQASRYFAIENAQYVAPDGTCLVYKKRRFLPHGSSVAGNRGVIVRAGDRLDTVAARALGDPQQFWRIADANDAMNPFDLCVPGKLLNIPTVRFGGPASS
jgi:nucleoid-associated protein YgaU